MKRIRNQPFQVITRQGFKYDLLHCSSGLTDRFQFEHERMGRVDLVVPVGADQHQVPHIRLGQEILEEVEGCCVEPLQIVEEQGEGVLRSCEYADKSPEHQLEAALRVLRRKIGNRRLVSDDELQFRHKVDDEKCIWTECLLHGIAPDAQLFFALTQERTHKTLKRLRQSGIRNVALVLVELAGGKKAARRDQRLVQLVDDGGLADPGIAGHEYQLQPAAGDDAFEGSEQGVDLSRAPVQFLRHK